MICLECVKQKRIFNMLKTTISPAFILLAGVACAAPLERATPESQGVDSKAVLKLVERLHAENDQVHGYMLLRHGKVIAEGHWAPFSPAERHALFSVSKAFVSMGIGFAVADRKMTLNDRVNWFFPEFVPTNQSAFAREMRVRDLMAMASGHGKDPFAAMCRADKTNCAKGFFDEPVVMAPGILFRYMSGNTAMLAQIHRRITGEDDLVKYLRPRLFDKLGIADYEWCRQPDGTVLGGSGFELRLEDLAKVSQLFLNGGRWNGERVLPLEWVKQATSCQTPYGKVMDPVLAHHVGGAADSGAANAENDWEQGYGYQLWMGRHETFRLCGAYGNIGVIMPDQNIVLAVHAGGNGSNMLSVEALYDTILPALSDKALPENSAALADLRKRSGELTMTYPLSAAKPSAEAIKLAAKEWYAPVPNLLGVSSVKFDAGKNEFTFVNDFGDQSITVGEKSWVRGAVEVEKPSTYTLSRVPGGKQPIGARGGWTAQDTFAFRICFLRTPFYVDFELKFKGGKLHLITKGPLAKRYSVEWELSSARPKPLEGLAKKISEKGYSVIKVDEMWNGKRTVFRFRGREAWVIEPLKAKEGNPWTWTMQWWMAFVPRTSVPDMIKAGYHHVVLDMFNTRANDAAMPVLNAYQRFLVNELGLAPKARLIGMSWGGFFSVRYAGHYPQNVEKIYLDCPLMNFDKFTHDISPGKWEKTGKDWSSDPRMPVNFAEKLAAAKIPLLLIYGASDNVVIPKYNCEMFIPRFKKAGGDIKVIRRGMYGHHPHGVDAGDGTIIEFFK